MVKLTTLVFGLLFYLPISDFFNKKQEIRNNLVHVKPMCCIIKAILSSSFV